MKVTQNIKCVVFSKVQRKVNTQYADEFEEAQRREELIRRFNNRLEEEMKVLRERRIAELLTQYDFVHDNRLDGESEGTPSDYYSLNYNCVDDNYEDVSNKVFAEATKIYNEIIGKLEACKTKEEFDKIIEEI